MRDWLSFLNLLPHAHPGHHHTHDALGADDAIGVELTVEPAPQMRHPSRITLRFRKAGKPVTLSPSHERILHVVIVSKSFDTFAHLHPEDFGMTQDHIARGEYHLQYAFPHGGEFLIIADFVAGDAHLSRRFPIDVQGTSTPLVEHTERQQTAGPYKVVLETPLHVATGADVLLRYAVSRNSAPVTDLQPYLAAPMHLLLVREDFGAAMHTHGELPGVHAGHHGHGLPSAFGPIVEAHVRFDEPGMYHIFGELQHDGRPLVTHFVIEASDGDDASRTT